MAEGKKGVNTKQITTKKPYLAVTISNFTSIQYRRPKKNQCG
jgi:hypothetical protein